jgi:hypothetical protein
MQLQIASSTARKKTTLVSVTPIDDGMERLWRPIFEFPPQKGLPLPRVIGRKLGRNGAPRGYVNLPIETHVWTDKNGKSFTVTKCTLLCTSKYDGATLRKLRAERGVGKVVKGSLADVLRGVKQIKNH